MEEGIEPRLIAYRKDSSNRVFKVDKKLKGQTLKKTEDQTPQNKPKETERKRCDCNGETHGVFSNCMNCGRLTCNFENEGNCMDCNYYVYPVDSENIPPEHLNNIHYKNALILRNKLLSFDNVYQSEDFKINDLKSGWFDELNDIYNEMSEGEKLKYIKQEIEKNEQGMFTLDEFSLEVPTYDLDLYTGRLSVSNK